MYEPLSNMGDKMQWKYAMVLVNIDSSDPDDIQEICQLVELYGLEESGYTSFCKANLLSTGDIEMAAKDVARDGINYWFYENGTFCLEPVESSEEWNWEIRMPLDRALLEGADLTAYEDETELYTVYGGD
jgi:hypothetical protein